MHHCCMEKSGWIKAEAQGQRAHLVETEQSQRGKRETKVGRELGCRKWDFINVCQNKDRKMDGMFLAIKQKLDLVFTNWQLASEGFLLQHQSKIPFFQCKCDAFRCPTLLCSEAALHQLWCWSSEQSVFRPLQLTWCFPRGHSSVKQHLDLGVVPFQPPSKYQCPPWHQKTSDFL